MKCAMWLYTVIQNVLYALTWPLYKLAIWSRTKPVPNDHGCKQYFPLFCDDLEHLSCDHCDGWDPREEAK